MTEKKAKKPIKKTEKKSEISDKKVQNSKSEKSISLPELPSLEQLSPEYKKKFASANNPFFEAMINGVFVLSSQAEANQKLQDIKNNFIISAKNSKDENGIIKLWLKNFSISEAEEKAGFLGNYANIKIVENKNKFSLTLEKIDTELKFHPQRKRPNRKHPDWGHPCLRLVKKEKIFENLEDAQKVLQQLFDEFPLVSILNPSKLYIILYSKIYQPPIKKFILEIKANKTGGFIIEYKENNYNKNPEAKKSEVKTENKTSENPKKGYFTSKVELNRVKKKPQNNQQFGGFSNRISIPNSDNNS
ncbi:MAG: hypothetical protein SFT90_01075 [Rickettsiales bacterium]|nr:hypothetical protein [Rickettsiales bacterium]